MSTIAPAVAGYLLAVGGLLGLVVGSFLNVVVYRVPAGISLLRPSRCPSCDAPVRPWQNIPVVSWVVQRGRCASCGNGISVRYPLVELATALAFVVVLSLVVETYDALPVAALVTLVLAYLYLASISLVLTLIDLDVRRLPNPIVVPAYVVMGVLFALACVFGAPWQGLVRAAVGGAALFAFYFVLRLIRPAGMGGGDVKLAGVLGAALGWIGWGSLVVGTFAAFVLGGVFGIALMLGRRAVRKTAIPFGPWMILGAWCGILAGEEIARWYIGMLTVG